MSSLGSNSEVFYRSGFDPSFPEAPAGAAHDEFRDALMAKNSRIALVGYSREKANFRELSVNKGEYLEVMDDTKKWWHCRNSAGETGFVPHTLLKALIYTDTFDAPDPIPEDDRRRESKRRSRGSSRRGRRRSSSSSRSLSPPRNSRRAPSPAQSIPPP